MQVIASIQSFHSLKLEGEEVILAKAESILKSMKDRGKAWKARLSADHAHILRTEEYIRCAFIKGKSVKVAVVLLPA